MPAQSQDWGLFRFSTGDLPEAVRVTAVRELHERIALPGSIEPLQPLPDCRVRVDITKRALPGLGIMSGTLSGVRQAARSRISVSSGEDDLLLAINLRGTSIVHQDDQELRLRDGDAMLATRGPSGFSIIRTTPARFLGLRVPRNAVAPLVGRLDNTPIQLMPRGSDTINLLATYAGAVVGKEPIRMPEVSRLVVTHIHDLISVVVGATRDSQATAERRGIAAARLHAIMADVTAHLGDCDLTATAVAQRQQITPRYVHKLFEQQGVTFSAFVLARRLELARRLLSDGRLRYRHISSVAFEVGFGDLSYFNRAFRRCYGATPSEVRQSSEGSCAVRE
jgi:AraC-like DNA-binding protein